MQRWLGISGAVGLVSVAGVFAAACSSASEPYPDVQSFCAAKASAECQVAAQCLAGTPACTSARQAACMKDADQATATGTRVFTPQNATNCITTVQTAFASAAAGMSIPYAVSVDSMTVSLQAIDLACQAVFLGIVPSNGKCTADADCAASADSGALPVCSPISPGSTTTRCAEAIPVAVGSPCANFGSVCAPGSYCHSTQTTAAICKAGGTSGPCSSVEPCGLGAFCNIAQGAKSGVCETGLPPGKGCQSSVDCGGTAPYCDPNQAPPAGSGSAATGSCSTGLFSFGSGTSDCKAYGGPGM